MVPLPLLVLILAAEPVPATGYIMAPHNELQIDSVHVSSDEFGDNDPDALSLPTGEIVKIQREPEPFLLLPHEVSQGAGVTLTASHHVLAVACYIRGGEAELEGYDIRSRRLLWRIPMNREDIYLDLQLAWYRDRYVVAERDGRTGCEFIIIDTAAKKVVFTKHGVAGGLSFNLQPGKVTVTSPDKTEIFSY